MLHGSGLRAVCQMEWALRRSALCASGEGWKQVWGLRAVGMTLVNREGDSVLGGREMVMVLVP